MLEAVLGLGGLALFFAFVLAYASRKFRIEEDPKLKEIVKKLPGVNCGACGFANCKAFAVAVIKGDVPIDGCRVGGKKVAEQISALLK
jgi:RnfABCDGE-type electron transport complex B subunit